MIDPKNRLPHRPVACPTLRANRTLYINTSYDHFWFAGPANDRFLCVITADMG